MSISMSTGRTELIDLRNEALAELFQYEDKVNEDDMDRIDMTLYVKTGILYGMIPIMS